MKTKHLLMACALPALFAACSQEEALELLLMEVIKLVQFLLIMTTIIRLAIILYMKDMLVIIDSHGMVLLESLRQMVPW